MKEIGGGGLQWLHSLLLLFILLLNSPSTKNTSHSVIPSPCLCLSLSLLLCSRLQHSQLLWGLQSYAIAQAESWGWGLNEVGEWEHIGWRVGEKGLNSNNKQYSTHLWLCSTVINHSELSVRWHERTRSEMDHVDCEVEDRQKWANLAPLQI